VPLALSPYVEDPTFLDPEQINNFDYTETGGRCPFGAHVRKTAPRNLQPVISKEYLDTLLTPNYFPVGKISFRLTIIFEREK